jgi:hypothetical protein
MAIYYKGKILSIHITDDGKKSVQDLAAVHANDIVSRMARVDMLLRVLADTGRLRSPDQFRQEGEKFWAVRAGPVRAYGWYEPNQGFVISHIIYKSETKLASADSKRMQKNQRDYRVRKK